MVGDWVIVGDWVMVGDGIGAVPAHAESEPIIANWRNSLFAFMNANP